MELRLLDKERANLWQAIWPGQSKAGSAAISNNTQSYNFKPICWEDQFRSKQIPLYIIVPKMSNV